MKNVCIVLPVYNGEKTIKNAIDSVLAQTYKDYQLVVVDDGSTDSTAQIVDSYVAKYEYITCIHKKNEGQAAARNTALQFWQDSNFYCFLDADDTLERQALQICVKCMGSSDADFLLFGFNVYSGMEGRLLRSPNPGDLLFKAGDSYEKFQPVNYLMASACNKIYRKEYIKHLFEEDMVYGEDSLFNYSNFSHNTNVLCIHDCLYNVNLATEGSVNKRFVKGKLLSFLRTRVVQKEKMEQVFKQEFDERQFLQAEVRTLAYMILQCLCFMDKDVAKEEVTKSLDSEYCSMFLSERKSLPIYYRILMDLCMKKQFIRASFYAKCLLKLKR